MPEKNYTLRAPKADDMFLMLRIISIVGVKNVKKCFENPDVKAAISGAGDKSEETLNSVGMTVFMEIAGIVLEHLEDCKKEIYTFLSKLSGMSVKAISEMSMVEFTEMIIDLVRMEEFKDFFTAVIKSFKQMM